MLIRNRNQSRADSPSVPECTEHNALDAAHQVFKHLRSRYNITTDYTPILASSWRSGNYTIAVVETAAGTLFGVAKRAAGLDEFNPTTGLMTALNRCWGTNTKHPHEYRKPKPKPCKPDEATGEAVESVVLDDWADDAVLDKAEQLMAEALARVATRPITHRIDVDVEQVAKDIAEANSVEAIKHGSEIIPQPAVVGSTFADSMLKLAKELRDLRCKAAAAGVAESPSTPDNI